MRQRKTASTGCATESEQRNTTRRSERGMRRHASTEACDASEGEWLTTEGSAEKRISLPRSQGVSLERGVSPMVEGVSLKEEGVSLERAVSVIMEEVSLREEGVSLIVEGKALSRSRERGSEDSESESG